MSNQNNLPKEDQAIQGTQETLLKLNITCSISHALSQVQIDRLKEWFESYLWEWPQPDCSVVLVADNINCSIHQFNSNLSKEKK